MTTLKHFEETLKIVSIDQNENNAFSRNISKHTHFRSEHMECPYVKIRLATAYSPAAPSASSTTHLYGSFLYNGIWFTDDFYKATGCFGIGFHVRGKNEFGEFIMSLIRTEPMTHYQMSRTYIL